MDAMMRALDIPKEPGQPGQRTHPSQHEWDLFALLALSGSEQARLEEHLATCEVCQFAHQQVEIERDDWANSPTKAVMWREIDAKIQQPPSLWDRLAALLQPAFLAPVGALGLFALLFSTSSMWKGVDPGTTPNVAPQVRGVATPGIRKKGSLIPPDFHTYLHRKGVSQALVAKRQLKGGDILGFTYNARDFRYLCVILIDRKGEISWLYPGKPAPSIEIASHGQLKGSVQLDNAPGPERLMAFFSAQPLSPTEIKKLLEKRTQADGLLTLPHQPAQTVYLRQRILHKR